MNEAELLAIIASHEADAVELTQSVGDTDKFAEAVCAFANDLPNRRRAGYLVIGVDNQGRCVGLVVSDRLLVNLSGLRADGNIQPLPMLTVEKVAMPGGDVAVVTVQPSDMPPVRYKGRVCIRVGPRRGYATEQEERVLIERRVARAKTFDAQPCLGAAVEDLAVPLFLIDYRQQAIAREVIDENGRSIELQLASLRFFDLASACPTHAGIVLFGYDIRRWLSGAYIQFLRIGGCTLTDPVLNERELQGDLLTMLRELDALVDAQMTQVPVSDTVLHERSVQAYPRAAIRELLMNAVMHRDYASTAPLRVTWLDDRIEIQSPGGLYGEATTDNFPRQTSYRNPIVAEAMKALGYVNRYGRGIAIAQDALARNGSPAPEFQLDAGYVLVIIRRQA